LAAFARAEGCSADWRLAAHEEEDVGERPSLDKLGPVCWTPQPAPPWSLSGPDGRKRSLADYRGKPALVLFYLGAGCAHCMEQLNAFAPKTANFENLGISIVAVSTESPQDLKKSLAKSTDGKGFAFPLVADPSLKTFRAYRAYDDFERQPLHGAFLVDGKGKVRWQDIGYEPFTQIDFLLKEAKRLLALEPPAAQGD
jgi:peroxiredoxin